MKKSILYRYNPETDDFERFYPSIKDRIISFLKYLFSGVIIGLIIFVFYAYVFSGNTENNLKAKNIELNNQLNLLNQRVNRALSVMEDIQNRDDNFYRVMMQMEPMSHSQRIAAIDNSRQKEIEKMSDSKLIGLLTRQIELLDRNIMAQSLSFDQLRDAAFKQQDKLRHIPAVLPINISDYTMSSGYGWRRDPIYNSSKFHQGLDFAASPGTKVYATADGDVVLSERKGEYGNCIEINHGYNYLTRFAHLSKLLVKKGEKVKRGDLIGLVGSTGKSTGPHLHYEVRFKDEAQNPINYYFLDITPEQYNQLIYESENAGHVMD